MVTRQYESLRFASTLKAKKAYDAWTDEEILAESASWSKPANKSCLETLVEMAERAEEEKLELAARAERAEEEKREMAEKAEKLTTLVRRWRQWSDGHEARCVELKVGLKKKNEELLALSAKAEEEKRELLQRAEKAEEEKRELVQRAEKAEEEKKRKRLELYLVKEKREQEALASREEKRKAMKAEEEKKQELLEDNMRKDLAIRSLRAEFEEREEALKKEVEQLKTLLVSTKPSSVLAGTIHMVGNEMATGLKMRMSSCLNEGEEVRFAKCERDLAQAQPAKVIFKDELFDGFLHVESNRCFRNASAACVALIEQQGTNKCAGSEHVFVNRGGRWVRIKSHKASWLSSTH